MNNNEILKYLDNQFELQKLYRCYPKQFCSWLSDALDSNPESETLKVWNARLNYAKLRIILEKKTKLFFVLVISIIALFILKLPVKFPISSNWFYPRFTLIVIFGYLITYFLIRSSTSSKHKFFCIFGVMASAFTMLLIPEDRNSASIIMSQNICLWS